VGRFYFKKKKFKAAASRFRRILDHYPSYPDKDRVYLRLGEALVRSGNEIEGKSYLNRVVEDYPGSSSASGAKKLLARSETARKKKERKVEPQVEPPVEPPAEPDSDAAPLPASRLEPAQNSRD
jgi:predicted Zn-dependent protease